MTNNTIPNVPRDWIYRVRDLLYEVANETGELGKEAFCIGSFIPDILSAPSPAGVDGPVRNFKTREGYDVWDKLCAIPKFGFLIGPSGGVVKVADIGNWIDRDEAQSVVDEAQCEVNLLRHEASAAQAIIDGLRVDVEVMTQHANNYSRMFEECAGERDQQAQRIGELEGLLRSCLPALSDGGCAALANRIDAALSAGK